MPLSVYVEGSKDTSAAGVKRLASLIAARYGLNAVDLEKRLAAGRFRVKANVDATTAHAFASDLEALGAHCSIVEAEVSGPIRGLKGIPALEQPAAIPPLERAPASSRNQPALSGELRDGGAGRPDLSAARVLTPSSARTITASAVPPPQAARTATPSFSRSSAPSGAPPSSSAGARPQTTTGSSAAQRPITGLSAATSVREPDSSSLNPPTLRSSTGLSAASVRPADDGFNAPTARGGASGLSAASVRPADDGFNAPTARGGASGLSAASVRPADDSLNPPTLRGGVSGLSAATVRPPDDSLNPPTLRGLSSSSRTPAHSMPPISSRTATFAGYAPAQSGGGPGIPGSTGGAGNSGLASALADASYGHAPHAGSPASSGASGLGALDGASFSLATLDGQEDAALRASAAAARGPYEEPPDYDTDSSYTPTLAFDEPPVHVPAPAYDSYPPRRPGTGRTSTPLRPATSNDLPPQQTSPPVGTTTGSVPVLRGPVGQPVDLFAPPPEAGPAQLHLAEELPRQRTSSLAGDRRGAAEAGPIIGSMVAPMVAPAVASPFIPRAGSDAATAARAKKRLRIAFAAGVFLSVFIGFVPAHLIAKSRARTAFERIDNRARIAQSEISSMAEWNALDDVRTALLRQKRAAQQEIALLSVLLWVGVTGALSFAWFRFGLVRFDPARLERED